MKPQNVLTTLQFGYHKCPLVLQDQDFLFSDICGLQLLPVRVAPSIFPFDFAVPSPLQRLSPLPRTCRKPAKLPTPALASHPTLLTPLEGSRLEHGEVEKPMPTLQLPIPGSPAPRSSTVKWVEKTESWGKTSQQFYSTTMVSGFTYILCYATCHGKLKTMAWALPFGHLFSTTSNKELPGETSFSFNQQIFSEYL